MTLDEIRELCGLLLQCAGIFLVLVAGIIFVIMLMDNGKPSRHETLMNQCIADGHKEYECEAMLIKHE